MTPGTQGVIVERAVLDEVKRALRDFADLGVGSGPDEGVETYRIERGAIRGARAALAKLSALTPSPPTRETV